jgi:hypothetical protein
VAEHGPGPSGAAPPPAGEGGAPNPDWLDWPDPPADGAPSSAQKVFEAQVGARGRRIDAAIARRTANLDADIAQNAEFQKALLDVAKGGIDRSRANAETVQKAAGAIGTIYTGILGVTFSVTSRPLPARGVLPAVFLGIAVALSTAYLAYMSRREDMSENTLAAGKTGLAGQFERVSFLLRWVRRTVRRRAWLLRSSVVGLALGVVLLPVAFISWGGQAATVPDTPPWPSSAATGLSPDLQKIRYQAEVDEVAKLRAARSTAPDDTTFTIVVFLAGLALVAVGGAVARGNDAGAAD